MSTINNILYNKSKSLWDWYVNRTTPSHFEYSHTNSLPLAKKIEALAQAYLNSSETQTVFLFTEKYGWGGREETVGSLRKELRRTSEWIQEVKQRASIELPHLIHMCSKESLVQKMKQGSIPVTSQAVAGAWTSTQPELEYGDYGLLLDVHHCPIGDYGLVVERESEWVGFQSPIHFKDQTFHLAGIVVPHTDTISFLREELNLSEEELPNSFFVTPKEAALRSFLTQEARREVGTGTIQEYLENQGARKVCPIQRRGEKCKQILLGASVALLSLSLFFTFRNREDLGNL